MSQNIIGDFDFDVECPNCEKEFSVNLSQVGCSVKCPHCGELIQLEDDGISETVEDAEDAINGFLKSF